MGPKQNLLKIVEPLKWLLGKWVSIKAQVTYPTMKPTDYYEEMKFEYFGQKNLAYYSKTWLTNNSPKHWERGFLTIHPCNSELSLILAHNSGLCTIEAGHFKNKEMKFKTLHIIQCPFAKEPHVCKLKRKYELCSNILKYELHMATTLTPMQQHLSVSYKKTDSECLK